MTSGVLRRAATAVLFGMILAGSLQHATSIVKRFHSSRVRGPNEYNRFLRQVLPRTRPGASIVVVTDAHQWRHYAPSFNTALYSLKGRTVLPAISADERPLPDHVHDADYLIFWKTPPLPDRPVLFRDVTGKGVLTGG
jgi:hypothetical protein